MTCTAKRQCHTFLMSSFFLSRLQSCRIMPSMMTSARGKASLKKSRLPACDQQRQSNLLLLRKPGGHALFEAAALSWPFLQRMA